MNRREEAGKKIAEKKWKPQTNELLSVFTSAYVYSKTLLSNILKFGPSVLLVFDSLFLTFDVFVEPSAF